MEMGEKMRYISIVAMLEHGGRSKGDWSEWKLHAPINWNKYFLIYCQYIVISGCDTRLSNLVYLIEMVLKVRFRTSFFE